MAVLAVGAVHSALAPLVAEVGSKVGETGTYRMGPGYQAARTSVLMGVRFAADESGHRH